MEERGTPGVCYQVRNEDYLPTLREIFVPAVNDPESWRAVRWGSKTLQWKRLNVLCQIVDCTASADVLDVGCGLGEFANHVIINHAYHGIDIVEEFIPIARKKAVDDSTFECHDLRDEPRPTDAVVASGTFTLCNDEIFWSMLDAMWESTRVLMAFNCKSLWAPKDCKSAVGYLRDPAETLALCRKRYTSNLKLDHSYLDHDFTIAMYR